MTAAAAARPRVFFMVITPTMSRKASARDNEGPWAGLPYTTL
jgi:hypothetical protein